MRVLNSEMAYFFRCPLSNATLKSFSLSPGLFVRRPCPLVWPTQNIQLFYVLDWFLDAGSSTRKKPDFWLHVCVMVSYAQKPFKLLPARPCSPPSRQIKANQIARPIQQIRISNYPELFSSNCKKAQERIWSEFRRRNIVHVEPIF